MAFISVRCNNCIYKLFLQVYVIADWMVNITIQSANFSFNLDVFPLYIRVSLIFNNIF